VTTSSECTVVIRYQPDAMDGLPWSVTHEDGQRVLTITDLDDSSLGIILRALALAGGHRSTSNIETSVQRAELATT
jgi:hypothetical protein